MERKLSLEEILRRPIQLPRNSFLEQFKRFMKYELIDYGVILSTTTALGYAMSHNLLGDPSKAVQDVLLTAAGPVLGKIAFLSADTTDRMRHAYSLTHKEKQPFLAHLRKAAKNAAFDLAENISVQDTTYMAAMAAFLAGGSTETPFMLSLLSYGISIGAVSVADVGLNELRFWHYRNKMKKAGFMEDNYYEATFCIRNEMDPDVLLG